MPRLERLHQHTPALLDDFVTTSKSWLVPSHPPLTGSFAAFQSDLPQSLSMHCPAPAPSSYSKPPFLAQPLELSSGIDVPPLSHNFGPFSLQRASLVCAVEGDEDTAAEGPEQKPGVVCPAREGGLGSQAGRAAPAGNTCLELV